MSCTSLCTSALIASNSASRIQTSASWGVGVVGSELWMMKMRVGHW